MLRDFGCLLLIIEAASISDANARPLSIYTEQAPWEAAMSGAVIGPYTRMVSQTVTLTTATITGGNCCQIDGATTAMPALA
jgi:hypothetical protein